MNAQTNLPANPRQATAQLAEQLTKRADQFAMVLPAHISPEKFQRTIITAVQTDPDLLLADRQSLLLACQKAAQDGLLCDKREAALVIFKKRSKDGQGKWTETKLVQYMPMVYGLRKKILQSGEITDITAKVVYRREVDEGAFLYEEGTEAMLRHKPLLDLTEEEARDENIIAAYSMATYKDGTKSYEVMRRFEIDKVRECSQTGATKDRYGKPREPSGPWVDWYPEQGKKTVMRRHSKTLPMSGDIVDVEGMELDLAARSTERVLAIRPDGPRALPDPGGDDDGQYDPETGALIEDQSATSGGVQLDQGKEPEPQRDERTGMTQVDEETARQLDTAADDKREAAEWAEGIEATLKTATSPEQVQMLLDENASGIARLEGAYPDLHAQLMDAVPQFASEPEKAPADDADEGKPTEEPWAEKRRMFIEQLGTADSKAAIDKVENEITKIFIQFPDPVADELEKAIGDARKRVRKAAATQQTEG